MLSRIKPILFIAAVALVAVYVWQKFLASKTGLSVV